MIAAAQKLQKGNSLEYSDNQVAQVPSGEGINPNQVQFVQVHVLIKCTHLVYFTQESKNMGISFLQYISHTQNK